VSLPIDANFVPKFSKTLFKLKIVLKMLFGLKEWQLMPANSKTGCDFDNTKFNFILWEQQPSKSKN